MKKIKNPQTFLDHMNNKMVDSYLAEKDATPSPSIPVKEGQEVLEITKGVWIVESFGKSFQIMSGEEGERSHIATLFTATMDNKEQQPANAKAICTAVNNTYGKGFDPSKMEELYKALSEYCEYREDQGETDTTMPLNEDTLYKQAKTALTNAKL